MISPKWAKGISPASRPSEGQGERLKCGGNGRPVFRIVFCFALFARGSQGPSDARRPGLWWGGGASCPLRPLFHTHVCFPRPRFFFRPLGPAIRIGELDAIECVGETTILPFPPIFRFSSVERGSAVRFSAFPVFLFFSKVLFVLAFCRGFSGPNFGSPFWGGGEDCSNPEMPLFSFPESGEKKFCLS